jgi:RND superfamily putative drug exporter
MELLGKANWWLPRWLNRIVPRVDVEGHEEPRPAEVGEVKELVGAGRGNNF